MAYIDLSGKKFGRLTAIEEAGRTKQGSVVWKCICDCGGSKSVSAASLRQGHTKSCGCLQKENPPPVIKTHGRTKTPEHNSWRGMIDRCFLPSSRYYRIYGGRGITVAPEWLSFEQFLADMGEKPSPSHSLDRIDPNKGYSKDNCRWATPTTQSYNRRTESVAGVRKTPSGKWHARIAKHYKKHLLGTFDSFFDAVAARKSAELKLYGDGNDY